MKKTNGTSGFTLVELLVALGLFSFLMLGIFSAANLFMKNADSLGGLAGESEDVRLLYAFLNGSLASASARQRVDSEPKRQGVWFAGNARGVTWLGLMPLRHGAGGTYHFRLSVEEGSGHSALLLEYAPFVSDTVAPHWRNAERMILIDELAEADLGYRAEGSGEWLGEWRAGPALPQSVQLRIRTLRQAWPPLMVHIHASGRS